jgi:hypothetical protein
MVPIKMIPFQKQTFIHFVSSASVLVRCLINFPLSLVFENKPKKQTVWRPFGNPMLQSQPIFQSH